MAVVKFLFASIRNRASLSSVRAETLGFSVSQVLIRSLRISESFEFVALLRIGSTCISVLSRIFFAFSLSPKT